MNDTREYDRCAQLLKAIADPERLKIVHCLRSGPLNVGEITSQLKRDIANISHHLGVLRQAGFVVAKKQGRYVVYRLNPEVFVSNSSGKVPSRIELGCCRLDFPQP